MFWSRKNTEQIMNLEEKLETKLEALGQKLSEGNTQLSDTARSLEQLQRSVREQGMSVEDLLEEWNERNAAEEDLRARLRECADKEQHLLELFEAYQEQLGSLKRFAGGRDEAWAAQIAMMENSLEHYRQMCGITLIGECGAEVDYDLYEVIEAVDTAIPEQDRKIADVYRTGYLYQGKVRRKAQVAVYAFNSALSQPNV